MVKVIKKSLNDLNLSKQDSNNCEILEISKDDDVLEYLYYYENLYHRENIYLDTNNLLEINFEIKEYINIAYNYFRKPLQVMVDSDNYVIVNLLKDANFKLVRKCFEMEISIRDIISGSETLIDIRSSSEGDTTYDFFSKDAYEYYIKIHKNINPLTATLAEFKNNLPKDLYYIKKDNDFAYVFYDGNELCYFGSNNIKLFNSFIVTVFSEMLTTYENIFMEIDNVDEIAMNITKLVSNDVETSFDTYIYTNSRE